jgi:TDG/mug DNA glycosylase family protein
MDRKTVEVYETRIDDYLRRDLKIGPGVAAFASRVRPGELRLDLGSGPGHMTAALGSPAVAVDAAWSMISRVTATPLRVQADLEALPFRRGALHGAWASKCLQHVPNERLPLALAGIHQSLVVDAPFDLVVFRGEGTWTSDRSDDLPGRMFWQWSTASLRAVVEGAGFVDVDVRTVERAGADELHLSATRARMLPDFVRPGLRVLFCGYNPSLYAADRGVPFARPGNRFWPAALAAGVVTADRDPWHAVSRDGVGFTDLVKRATVAAAELSRDELRAGLERVTRLCEWLRPEAVCFLGVGGWRDLVDRKAAVGWQPQRLGPSRVYVMPNPSGLNASTQHEGFVEHLTRVSGSG